jgi:hypothetical protein
VRVGGGGVNPTDGDFDTDTAEYKVRHVLGGTLMDPKAAVASLTVPAAELRQTLARTGRLTPLEATGPSTDQGFFSTLLGDVYT